MNEIVTCNVVDGVEIDQAELTSMAEMMAEAASKNPMGVSDSVELHGPNRISEAQPITRSSLAMLTGDENNLLSESPVFEKAGSNGPRPHQSAQLQDLPFNSRQPVGAPL